MRISKPAVVSAFQLYTDGEIIAAFSTLKAGLTSMPGLAIEGHVLRYTAVSLDQQMSRYMQMRDFSKERMQGRVQTITKQIIDVTAAEFSWWQADIVNDQ